MLPYSAFDYSENYNASLGGVKELVNQFKVSAIP